jgi:tight adherence protein B
LSSAADNAAWLAFGSVLLIAILASAVIPGGGSSGRIRKRAERLARASKGISVARVSDPLRAGSIRREEEGGGGALEALAKRCLPRQSVLRERLARTGHDITLATYLMVNLGIGVATFVAAWLAGGVSFVLSGCTALILGLGVPHLTVRFLAMRRRRRFIANLPDAIDLIVRGLKSGLPVSESMAAVGREIAEPVGDEFRQIMDNVRFGRSLDAVLWESARRIDASEFNFFVISLSIQQETGGNLAETLGNLSDIVRRRRQMRLKISALSGEAKASAYILGSLPFIMFGVVHAMSPDYTSELFTDPRGMVMVGAGIVSMLIGIAIMMKMVRFEI